jgi:hypothetical protein
MLIDSGASLSLLSKEIFDQLPEQVRASVKPVNKNLKFADGSLQKCEGSVELNIKLGHITKVVNFIIGNFSDQAILGMADLLKLDFTVDFKNLQVTTPEYSIPIYDISHLPISRKVVSDKDYELFPRKQTVM